MTKLTGIKITDLEKKLNIRIKKNAKVLGLDTATRTGWCLLITDNNIINKEYGFISVKTKDKNKYFQYNEIIDLFNNVIKKEYEVIIEDTFFRFNPSVFRLISRIGAIAYTLAHLKGCSVKYILATSARKNLGFLGNMKKKDFHIAFLNKSELDLADDIDIIDAYVLALNGLLDDKQYKIGEENGQKETLQIGDKDE